MSSTIAGTTIRSTCTFTGIPDPLVPMDPSTVICKSISPAGTVTTLTTTKVAVGIYFADVELTVAGPWAIQWEGTGVVDVVSIKPITVRPAY